MIPEFALQGLGNEALTMFHGMERENVKPNDLIFWQFYQKIKEGDEGWGGDKGSGRELYRNRWQGPLVLLQGMEHILALRGYVKFLCEVNQHLIMIGNFLMLYESLLEFEGQVSR